MIQNGLKYVLRKKVRTLLLLSILLAMSTSLLCAFSIQKASLQAKDKIYEKIGAGFTLSNNLFNNLGTARGSGTVKKEDIETIEKLDGITKVNKRMSAVAKLNNAHWIPLQNAYYPIDKKYEDILSITGESDSSLDKLFTSNVLKLTQGTHIQNEKHVALVHETFAKENNLKIGDTLQLQASLYDSDNIHQSTKTIATTIIGLFTGQNTTTPTMEDEMSENKIITDLDTIRDLYMYDGDEIYQDATFFTTNASQVEYILNEAKKLPIDYQNYQIQENGSDYAALSESIENINGSLHILVIATCIISALILTIILFLYMNTRQKEIAILLSIGKNKVQILTQFLFEMVLIGTISFVLSIGISKPLSQSIGQHFLNQSSEQSLDAMNQSLNGLLGNDLESASTALTIDSLDVSIDTDSILSLASIGYIVIITATVASSLPMLKKKPKDILTHTS